MHVQCCYAYILGNDVAASTLGILVQVQQVRTILHAVTENFAFNLACKQYTLQVAVLCLWGYSKM